MTVTGRGDPRTGFAAHCNSGEGFYVSVSGVHKKCQVTFVM